MPIVLSELTPVDPNTDLLAVITARRINAIQNAIIALARAENLRFDNWFFKRPSGSECQIAFNNLSDSLTSSIHPYTVKDATTSGTTEVIVTPGNHLDTSSGGTSWVPTITPSGGSPTLITAMPAPKLPVPTGSTVIYFKITVNALDGSGSSPAGQITAIEIDADTSVPSNTNTVVYQVVDYVTVVASTSVTPLNAGVSGSQVTQPCSANLLFGLQ